MGRRLCKVSGVGALSKMVHAYLLLPSSSFRLFHACLSCIPCRRFGIVYVDYATQRRYVKASALWLSRWFGLGDSAGTGNAGAAGQAADGGTEEEHAEL